MTLKNVSIVPRLGKRASVINTQDNQCTGAEWTRRTNASFFGTFDVGGQID